MSFGPKMTFEAESVGLQEKCWKFHMIWFLLWWKGFWTCNMFSYSVVCRSKSWSHVSSDDHGIVTPPFLGRSTQPLHQSSYTRWQPILSLDNTINSQMVLDTNILHSYCMYHLLGYCFSLQFTLSNQGFIFLCFHFFLIWLLLYRFQFRM